MEIMDFRQDARPIDGFESRGATVRVMARELAAGQLVTIRLEPGGVLGRHEAVANQLLLVTAGSGTVIGGDGAAEEIEVGQAAVWIAGESHETRAGPGGLTAVVLEGVYTVA